MTLNLTDTSANDHIFQLKSLFFSNKGGNKKGHQLASRTVAQSAPILLIHKKHETIINTFTRGFLFSLPQLQRVSRDRRDFALKASLWKLMLEQETYRNV